jgi:hypothetical protein
MELNMANTAASGGPDNSNSNPFEEEGINPTRALLCNITHASVRAAHGADSINSKFFDLLTISSYMSSLSQLLFPNYYTEKACLSASRIHQLSEFYKALVQTISIHGNLPNCERGSFMTFADNVTNTAIENTKGNLKIDTEIYNNKYCPGLGLKLEDLGSQKKWEQKCLNYTSIAEPENSNELFQIYDRASTIYRTSRMTIEDLKTFNIATERADDDKMGGVFVFLLMYCDKFPDLPTIIRPHGLFNLLELDNCWRRTKIIWGLLPKTMSPKDYNPDEDPDIIKLMTTIDEIISIWNKGCNGYERIEINKKGDIIPQETELLDEAGETIFKYNEVGAFITQSNSVILHTLTHVLDRFVFQLLPQPPQLPQPAYNDFFTGKTYKELVLYIQKDTIKTKTYENFAGCRVVILPKTLDKISERKTLLQRIKEIKETQSQTVFEDGKQLSLDIKKLTDEVKDEIDTAIENPKSCSLRSSSMIDDSESTTFEELLRQEDEEIRTRVLGVKRPKVPGNSRKYQKRGIGGKKRFTRKNTKKFTKKSHKKIKTKGVVSKHSHRKRQTKNKKL